MNHAPKAREDEDFSEGRRRSDTLNAAPARGQALSRRAALDSHPVSAPAAAPTSAATP